MTLFSNCDGAGPHRGSEVRKMRLGKPGEMAGNMILCRACWNRELSWRRQRNRELSANPVQVSPLLVEQGFELPLWDKAEVYE